MNFRRSEKNKVVGSFKGSCFRMFVEEGQVLFYFFKGGLIKDNPENTGIETSNPIINILNSFKATASV